MNDKIRNLAELIISLREGNLQELGLGGEPTVYGIPDSNKYPLDTPQRVIFAIRIFNTIREEFHDVFAEAIVRQAQKFGIDLSIVPETSALFKYLPRADKAESRQSDQHIPVASPQQPDAPAQPLQPEVSPKVQALAEQIIREYTRDTRNRIMFDSKEEAAKIRAELSAKGNLAPEERDMLSRANYYLKNVATSEKPQLDLTSMTNSLGLGWFENRQQVVDRLNAIGEPKNDVERQQREALLGLLRTKKFAPEGLPQYDPGSVFNADGSYKSDNQRKSEDYVPEEGKEEGKVETRGRPKGSKNRPKQESPSAGIHSVGTAPLPGPRFTVGPEDVTGSVNEAFTLDQLEDAFSEAGLDTGKYTTEYLAEQLGFVILNEKPWTEDDPASPGVTTITPVSDIDPSTIKYKGRKGSERMVGTNRRTGRENVFTDVGTVIPVKDPATGANQATVIDPADTMYTYTGGVVAPAGADRHSSKKPV
jgi:hypothetical protein